MHVGSGGQAPDGSLIIIFSPIIAPLGLISRFSQVSSTTYVLLLSYTRWLHLRSKCMHQRSMGSIGNGVLLLASIACMQITCPGHASIRYDGYIWQFIKFFKCDSQKHSIQKKIFVLLNLLGKQKEKTPKHENNGRWVSFIRDNLNFIN